MILWKYQQKEHLKYKGSLPTLESLVLLLDFPLHAMLCFILIRKQFCAMWKKQCACFMTIE